MNDEKKKVKQAVALEYDPSDEAPRVIASGKGILAEKIIEKAQESSVQYRSGDEKGNAAEAVTTAKQRTICRVADYYRYLHHYGEDTWVRYDVVAIQGEALHWIPNAFPHHYSARR